jgi:NSD-like protein with Cys-His rich domain
MDDRRMRIDCDDCAHQGTSQCDDCVVSFLLDREDGALVVDAEEARALRSLGEAGLVPVLRLRPKPPDRGREAG